MKIEDLKNQAEQIRWYQTIDLGNGITTKGADNTPVRLKRLAMPANLQGQTVLDIGAWDGFFSFEAERRGAARVLATDRWQEQGWDSKAGFEFARTVLESRVEDQDISVYDITPGTVGEFDVVLFLGVLYHLKDPLLALERVAAVTKSLLIVETAVDLLHVRRPAMAFYPNAELNGDSSNWWAPNLACLESMLHTCGFREIRCVYRHSFFRRAAFAAMSSARRTASLLPTLAQGRSVFHARK